ncbi:eukaryotic translation initiation factor eIF2A-domain-containing protein [Phlyctochytrium arcticum]|nr:eukaryotic translation initiation factor eIF2A-domain-containing protein [Phlyctochytrium arcticum]
MTDVVPIPQFAYRSQEGLIVGKAHPEYKPIEGFSSDNVKLFIYSPEGRYLAWLMQDCIKIFNASTQTLVQTIPQENVIDIKFSTRGNYLSTWERFVKGPDSETDPHKNLLIWDVTSGAQLTGFCQKNQYNWNVDWTEEETYCVRQVSNEIHFFDPQQFEKGPSKKLRVEGVASFSLSPGKRTIVAVFVAEKKGQPGSVKLYDVANFTAPLAQKSFFRADTVNFHWNRLGTNVLVFTHTDVDKTGKSYYGETNLYYLSVTGTFDCRVDLPKAGPVHDVAWSPNSKEFVVVYGTMPSKTTLFDHRANAIYEFGEVARNSVRFNTHGRLLYIGGFGNLAGELDIWDRKTFKKLTTISAPNSSSCEWCPNGKHIMTTTLYRRLKVDNGIKIWHYTGVLVHKLDLKELYQAEWRGSRPEFWPDIRSLSPPPPSVLPTPAASKPAGVYRPPGARGAPSKMLERPSDVGGRVVSSGIPGQFQQRQQEQNDDKNVSKAALKNKKKREAKKKEETNGATNGSQELAPPPFTPLSGAHAEIEKKMKNVNKKLKQIAEIKAKIQAGEKVELTQVKKSEGEPALRDEMKDLRKQLDALRLQA